MTNSVTHFSRFGALAFVCASVGIAACSSTDEGTSVTGRGGSNTGGTGGAGGATGGNGGVTTGGSSGSGASGGGTTGGKAGTGGSGGATGGTGGVAGAGGATGGTGGVAGTGGATGGAGGAAGTTGGGAGTGGTAGKGGTAGTSGSGGTAGSSGTGGATGGTGGAAGTGGTGGAVDAGTPKDSGGGGSTDASGARFSFFVVSQAAMVALSGNAKGFGGDFRFGEADGLTGADKICTQTAERSMAGNGKTWRAFLSVTMGPSGTAVNAADRIGDGPWYDRIGRLVAATKADLLQARPKGADPAIINDLPNEDGVPNQTPVGSTTAHDNHATVTGSTAQGTLHSAGLQATCQDWTSAAADGGKPQVGLTFPRGTSASNWISVQAEPGCLPGGTIVQTGGAPPGDYSIGASGGYGGFYCLALTP
jgi:hypothetical protein